MLVLKYEGDPHTYMRKKKDKRYYCQCQERIEKEDGEYKCNFLKREDHLKIAISKGDIHKCKFVKEEYNQSIEDYFKKEKEEIKDKEVTVEDIMTNIAIFVGRKNLSIDAGASTELKKLIRTAIKFGQQLNKADINEIFPEYSSATVRKYVISTASEIHKIQFKLFSQLPYVGVSCDEGSTKGIHDLDFVLENPLSDLKPYPCFTTVMKDGKAETYAEHLARGINFIKFNKISIASLTVDGNKAQLKALAFDWVDSLRNRYIDQDEYINHILVNHCLCHRINNAYKATYSKSADLRSIVDHLRNLSEECRSHPEDIHEVCPKVQLTRWVVDFDICQFILNHQQIIAKFTEINVEGLNGLFRVLSILKSLTNIFEDPKTPHFRAYRLIENAIGALETLNNEIPYSKDVADELYPYENPKSIGRTISHIPKFWANLGTIVFIIKRIYFSQKFSPIFFPLIWEVGDRLLIKKDVFLLKYSVFLHTLLAFYSL